MSIASKKVGSVGTHDFGLPGLVRVVFSDTGVL